MGLPLKQAQKLRTYFENHLFLRQNNLKLETLLPIKQNDEWRIVIIAKNSEKDVLAFDVICHLTENDIEEKSSIKPSDTVIHSADSSTAKQFKRSIGYVGGFAVGKVDDLRSETKNILNINDK